MVLNLQLLLLKSLKVFRLKILKKEHNWLDESRVEFWNETANDLVYSEIRNALDKGQGLAIGKFGTIELTAVISVLKSRSKLTISDYEAFVRSEYDIFPENALKHLYNNAGFFPKSVGLMEKYVDLVIEDLKYLDILGSYIDLEKFLEKELSHTKKVNLNGYYAPFLWEHPWTRVLENKRVLVIHPFVESIENQYNNKRKYIFSNPDVLPRFRELVTIKAVQSIAGNGEKTGFNNWFEALQYMEDEIDKVDFDIALIGCGAYGMDLAAYIKRKGKVAVHLAGWTQMLFGIYGNRWLEDQPEFKQYINEYWIRPSESEKPRNLEKVENGCYW